MTGWQVVQVAAGVLLALLGLWALVRNRAVGAFFAGVESDSTRYEYSLLNRERAERIRASVDDPGTRVLDRGKALFFGFMVVVLGIALAAEAIA